MCLSHSSSLRSGKSVRYWAPRLSLRSSARDAGALGVVEHVAELDRAEDVLVEDAAAVVDVGGLGLLLEAADGLQRLLDPGLVAEDGDLGVHHRARGRA